MNFSLYIALRYLFSKKTHNAINIISMICASGICVATISLVCTLSVYNGFQRLITNLFNSFDPELKISLVEGKIFDINTAEIQNVKQLDYIDVFAEVIEENALIKNKEKQTAATIKGVPNSYLSLINPDSVIYEGDFVLQEDGDNFAVVGAALASQIEAGVFFIRPISIYAPKHNTKVNLSQPERSFNERQIYISGVYAVNQQEIDSKFVFVSIDFARELFNYGSVASAIELKFKNGTNISKARKEISSILGDNYKLQNREEQHEDFYKMMKIEKWITFLILFFILLVAVFNVIGSLTMLIIEKEGDIITLKNLGANNFIIRNIFLLEGWLITIFGAISGLIIGLTLCFAQQFLGIIKLKNNGIDDAFIIDSYPVYVQASDIFLILITVILIGFLVVWYPTRYVTRSTK